MQEGGGGGVITSLCANYLFCYILKHLSLKLSYLTVTQACTLSHVSLELCATKIA